jgi:hypothetical protein
MATLQLPNRGKKESGNVTKAVILVSDALRPSACLSSIDAIN